MPGDNDGTAALCHDAGGLFTTRSIQMSDFITMADPIFWTRFFELFASIPRQGPGLNSATRQALGLLPPLGPDKKILDIGCGAGVQTLELARSCQAKITATDLHAPFLEILARNAAEQGLGDRIRTQVADMGDLPFADGSFDVVWAEGSSFIVGFARAVELWRRLLKPGGWLVLSEFTWFADDPPPELREFCLPDPAEDGSIPGRRRSIAEAGYELVSDFPLPREGWVDAYHGPLRRSLVEFERRYAGDPAAAAVSAHCRHEFDLFERYPEHFGYMFFILKA
jgi:SAM-dependent methyltransferase